MQYGLCYLLFLSIITKPEVKLDKLVQKYDSSFSTNFKVVLRMKMDTLIIDSTTIPLAHAKYLGAMYYYYEPGSRLILMDSNYDFRAFDTVKLFILSKRDIKIYDPYSDIRSILRIVQKSADSVTVNTTASGMALHIKMRPSDLRMITTVEISTDNKFNIQRIDLIGYQQYTLKNELITPITILNFFDTDFKTTPNKEDFKVEKYVQITGHVAIGVGKYSKYKRYEFGDKN